MPRGLSATNRKEDKFVLEFVADSRYVTRSQLFEFARLEYGEYNRPVFIGESAGWSRSVCCANTQFRLQEETYSTQLTAPVFKRWSGSARTTWEHILNAIGTQTSSDPTFAGIE